MEKIQLQEISNRIELLRNIAVFFHFFSLIVVVTILFIPNILSETLKIWCITVAGSSFLAIIVILYIARKDSTVTLFFTLLSASSAGLFIGIFVGKVDGLI